MAKKNIKKKADQEEPITNSCLGKRPIGPSGDQSEGVVTNCDRKNINIESLIRAIRGQRVMFDSDLAMLYGVETRALNQAVKRNLRRFPDDFMFRLTAEEWAVISSQFVMTSRAKRPKSALPLVFTEHGALMLSSVLRSDVAGKVLVK